MALEVSMTGSGSIGNIAPGWSVNEYTNSNTIGDTGASTGSVSFNARSTDDSVLVINNDVVSSVHDLGTVHGIVQSVSESGISVGVTHGTVADRLNLDVQVQPVAEGGPKAWCSALEYAIGIGPNPYTAPVNYVPSFAVQGESFGFFGSLISNDYAYKLNQFLDLSNGYPATPTFNIGVGTTSSTQGAGNTTTWKTLDFSQLQDIDTWPFWFSDSSNATYSVIQFALTNDAATNVSFGFATDYGVGGNGFIVKANGSAKTFGIDTVGATKVDYSTLDDSEPLMFTLSFGAQYYDGALLDFRYRMRFAVTDHLNNYVEALYNGYGYNVFLPYHRIQENDLRYMTFYTSDTLVGMYDYIAPVTSGVYEPSLFDFSGYTGTSVAPYPATSGVAWELLQQLAAAENFEVAISGDKVYIRDVGTTAFDITNIAPSASINPQSTLSGRQINIPYTDAEYIYGVVYDAEQDGNNVITVEAGATTITSVKHTVTPLYLEQPTRYLATGTGAGAKFVGPLPAGTYFVSDSTGLPISANEWEDYGGSLSVGIDPDDNAAIQITLVGPYVEIPSTTGPYSLQADDGENQFAALKISGTGVYSGTNVLELTTGIDPDKYTRATVNTITNPFIGTIEQAYDRGVWASLKASGPVVTLSLTVPVSSLSGIGLTCGSLIDYHDSTYRIRSCSISGGQASIEADFFATVARVDESWDGKTVLEYDTAWLNYECQDQVILPYLHSEAVPIP